MEKAVILSVVAILALLGLHKIVQWLEALVSTRGKNPLVLFYKIEGESEKAEFIIRSLALESRKIICAKRSAVYIVSDGLDSQTLDICRKTAQQYSNVFVGSFKEAELILEEKNT
ncbi:MAG: hypothetical protein UHH95_02305 [Oscillospiraceae bacterium]|nr:hypothetical protein [Oscillospiraceae bacterium]